MFFLGLRFLSAPARVVEFGSNEEPSSVRGDLIGGVGLSYLIIDTVFGADSTAMLGPGPSRSSTCPASAAMLEVHCRNMLTGENS